MIFTLSSIYFSVISVSHTEYGAQHLLAISRSAFQATNASYLLKYRWREVMSPAYLRQ